MQSLEDDITASALPGGELEVADDGQFLSADGKFLPLTLLQGAPTEEEEGGPVLGLPGDAPPSDMTAALLFSDDGTGDELEGDEGQLINPLLPGITNDDLAGRAGQNHEGSADLMARRAPVRTLSETSLQPQALIATAQGSPEFQSAAHSEDASRLAMLDGSQAGGMPAIDTNSVGQQQSTPLQGMLQPTPLQAQGPDRTAASLTLQTPLQQAEWGDEMGHQVKWLISQKMQSAEMKLNPPQLGAIEVRVTVQQDQVNLHFNTPHALVKDSLEESLPRLREVLQESGLNLANVDVSQQDTGQRQAMGDEADFDPARHGGGQETVDADADEAASVTTVHRGMVDFYA
ncbi:MAG: flagellar hook-length control protein FliK [Gammaproteobacteria bacterium]